MRASACTRLFGFAFGVGLMFTGVVGAPAPAGATTPAPVAGTMTCALAGSFAVRPALKSSPSTKPVMMQGTAITASPCDLSKVTGGKGTEFMQARVALNGTLAKGALCSDAPLPIAKFKPVLRIYVLNLATGKNVLDATVKAQITSMAIQGGVLSLSGTIPQNAKLNAPFAGEIISASIPIQNGQDVVNCENGTASLSTITFGAGATLTVSTPCTGPIPTTLQEMSLGNFLWVVVVPTSSTPICMPSGNMTLTNLPSGLCPTLLVHGVSGPLTLSPFPGTDANAGQDLMGFELATGANVATFTSVCEPFVAHYSGDAVFGSVIVGL